VLDAEQPAVVAVAVVAAAVAVIQEVW